MLSSKHSGINRLVFGGSFNPPHKGHLSIMEFVITQNICDRISVLPALVSPFKTNTPPIAAFHRIHMIELLLTESGHSNQIDIEEVEIEKKTTSYTIESLQFISHKYQNDKIALLIGSDHLAGFNNWKSADQILKNYPLYIFKRNNDHNWHNQKINKIKKNSELECITEPIVLKNELIDCSSTRIRSAITQKDETEFACLTPKVLDYIQKNQLYC